MGKMLWTEDGDEFDKTNPGCIFGIFHVLHHQYWHSNVKKIIPHTSHKALVKHAKRNRRYKRVSDDEDPFEVLQLLDHETSHILVDNKNTKTSSTHKRSLKARIKALVSDDTFKEDVVSIPRLQRTFSVHHSESNEWVHPIIFFPENVNSESPKVTNHEIKDSGDILEMFEVGKDRFIHILQGDSQVSDIKPRLTKSGSFPRKIKPTTLEDKLNEFYTKSKSKKFDSSILNNDFNNTGISIKRASSLNESTDRYACLFEFSNEASLRPSRSLKLSDNFLNPQKPSFLRSFSQHETHPVSTQDSESLNDLIDKSDNISEKEHSSCPQEEEFQISQDLDVICDSQENLEKEIETVQTNKQVKSRQYQDDDDDDDFSYMKKILERSGFIKNGFEQTWYSSNQPLDPFVFQEIESEYFHDPENFEEELNELSHRLLIFELVDEVLVTMYERSLTYYPKALSSFCHIHPLPDGQNVLDEVWKCVSRLIELKPDMDHIVSRDLGSDDGWMNLQLDSECVGLDLEDLILDELLEEFLYECNERGPGL